jgi:hypothetical protein
VLSARASWRREATATRVCGARALTPHSPAPHYIDPTNGLSSRRPIRVLILLGSISSPRMIASWAYHQQSPTCTRDNHIGKFSFQPIKCVTCKVYVRVSHPVLERNRMHLICASESSSTHMIDDTSVYLKQYHNEREYHSTLLHDRKF